MHNKLHLIKGTSQILGQQRKPHHILQYFWLNTSINIAGITSSYTSLCYNAFKTGEDVSCVKSRYSILNLIWYLVLYPVTDTDILASPSIKQNNKATGNLKMTLSPINLVGGGNMYIQKNAQVLDVRNPACAIEEMSLCQNAPQLLHGWGCCLPCTDSNG